MSKPDIPLTPPERQLFDQIVLDNHGPAFNREAHLKNGALITKLFGLLINRGAIAEHRLSYFTKPEYNIGGRGSSRRQIFERNGTSCSAILSHGNFLPYFRYFVCGPDLPPRVLERFGDKVAECGQVTSSDIPVLCKFARQLARTHHLDPRTASEEFFKLALDHGLDLSTADFIRNQVRSVRHIS